jgi:hypothetical protein
MQEVILLASASNRLWSPSAVKIRAVEAPPDRALPLSAAPSTCNLGTLALCLDPILTGLCTCWFFYGAFPHVVPSRPLAFGRGLLDLRL